MNMYRTMDGWLDGLHVDGYYCRRRNYHVCRHECARSNVCNRLAFGKLLGLQQVINARQIDTDTRHTSTFTIATEKVHHYHRHKTCTATVFAKKFKQNKTARFPLLLEKRLVVIVHRWQSLS